MRKWTPKWFDFPPDVTGEVPRIEMIGPYRLQIENHRGIEHFRQGELKLRTTQGILQVSGEQLKIKAIYPEVIIMEGTIHEVRYLK
jgi:sporulation protein YqfC